MASGAGLLAFCCGAADKATMPATSSHDATRDSRVCMKVLPLSTVRAFLWRKQPRERQRAQLPRTALLHIDLCHHEGIGHLIAANHGDQPDSVQQDRGRANEPHRDVLDIDVLVLNPSASDDIEFLGLGHRCAHMHEDSLIMKES